MSLLLTIIIILVSLVAIVFIIAFFSKNEFEIVREITIRKPINEVFDYVKLLRNSERFNKWVMADPNMKKEFRGTDGTVGFIYAWNSENKQVGQGEQEITDLIEDKRVDYEIRFERPFKGKSKAWFDLKTVGDNQTNVTWVFSSSNKFMMKVFHLVFNLKKVLGKDLQTSLNNLKNILEK